MILVRIFIPSILKLRPNIPSVEVVEVVDAVFSTKVNIHRSEQSESANYCGNYNFDVVYPFDYDITIHALIFFDLIHFYTRLAKYLN